MNNSTMNETAQKSRAGEELDVKAVHHWISQHIDGLADLPSVKQFSGGASNWTYCLTYSDRELILRRAPAGTKAKGAHNMVREYQIQNALKPVFNYVPTMYALCEDEQVIGTDFYVMEKIDGIIPRKNLPSRTRLDESQVKALCTNMLDALIGLHSVDIDASGLSGLAKGEGYVERQVNGWSKRYQDARTWNVPSGKKVMRWLQEHKPQHETICLTHNDFRFDNLVLAEDNPSQIVGVLDWELATLGDPLMDLGNTLAYWVHADDDFMAKAMRRQPTHLMGMMTRKEVINYYLEKRGLSHIDFRFYEVFGLFRLAAIAQQIYYRYHHKQTTNPAFKNFWLFIHYLLWRCNQAIKAK
ncbi:phosphotransferase family protein [Reinekea sp.]|uniref:phosphotransferase family protein n=1 Tax=Reinekea sp. TaxID=1970455 RepID=UPI00398916BF